MQPTRGPLNADHETKARMDIWRVKTAAPLTSHDPLPSFQTSEAWVPRRMDHVTRELVTMACSHSLVYGGSPNILRIARHRLEFTLVPKDPELHSDPLLGRVYRSQVVIIGGHGQGLACSGSTGSLTPYGHVPQPQIIIRTNLEQARSGSLVSGG